MIEFGSVELSQQLLVVINAGIAALLGSAIGWERDRAGKSVGPRTMALVGASAAAIVNIGQILDVNAKFGDPTRAMHAIITGIGFLGAGLIFQTRDSGTKGVTTAAAVANTVAAVVTPLVPESRVWKIKPAPRKPIPVMIACIARVGSPNLAFTSRI